MHGLFSHQGNLAQKQKSSCNIEESNEMRFKATDLRVPFTWPSSNFSCIRVLYIVSSILWLGAF